MTLASAPTWRVILEAAERLTHRGRTPFTRAMILYEIGLLDPERLPGTVSPVLQGMTVNATGGPPSACGKVLRRVDRGTYVLLPEAERLSTRQAHAASRGTMREPARPARRVPPRLQARPPAPAALQKRLQGLLAGFDTYVAGYDAAVPFVRSGQYELHRRTIDLRRRLGSVRAAVADPTFVSMLHQTLQAWGIGRRASILVPLGEFRGRLEWNLGRIEGLEPLHLEQADLDGAATAAYLDRLITDLGIVHNASRIVAGTKALHHLLPDLVPPMDRAWTGRFFGWAPSDPQLRQGAILTEAFVALGGVARATRPSRLVGPGWRTSSTKILDNVLIGYLMSHGEGGVAL